MSTFPVSVVVPHIAGRAEFFQRFCLPSIEANRPAEIIVKKNDGSDSRLAQVCRNAGARESTQPFLLFVDDDAILAGDCLSTMVSALSARPDLAYAYSDFVTVPVASGSIAQINYTPEFDPDALRRNNYINTMSLIRREAFPGFDEGLRRLQDWDLWLTMLERGRHGLHVGQVLFHQYSIDVGISAREGLMDAVAAIINKHAAIMQSPK